MDYIKKINDFVDQLPASTIRFLYFSKVLIPVANRFQEQWVPCVNTNAKLWNEHGISNIPILYIIPGKNDGYCYIYKESAIKYEVHINQLGDVDSFHPKVAPFVTIKGGMNSSIIEANLGNHITIGLEKSDENPNDWHFMTHITRYTPMKSDSTKYKKESAECNILLDDFIKHTSVCVNQPYKTLDFYETYENNYEIIPILKKIHSIISNTKKGGNIIKIKYKNKLYKLYTGVKGGKYIIDQNRKVYLRSNVKMKGGADMYKHLGFSETFIDFFQNMYIQKVATKNLQDIYFMDDEENENCMIRLDENHGDGRNIDQIKSQLFIIPKQYIWDIYEIYKIPAPQRSVEQSKQLDSFIDSIIPLTRLLSV